MIMSEVLISYYPSKPEGRVEHQKIKKTAAVLLSVQVFSIQLNTPVYSTYQHTYTEETLVVQTNPLYLI